MGVLVRDSNNEKWQYTIFCEYNDSNAYSYICINNRFIMNEYTSIACCVRTQFLFF